MYKRQLRHGVRALQKRGFEILTDECKRDADVFDAELLAMPRGALGLALVVVAPIVERYGQCDFLGLFMQEGDAIHASRYDDCLLYTSFVVATVVVDPSVFARFLVLDALFPLPPVDRPVSYTHLDVYKRQPMRERTYSIL